MTSPMVRAIVSPKSKLCDAETAGHVKTARKASPKNIVVHLWKKGISSSAMGILSRKLNRLSPITHKKWIPSTYRIRDDETRHPRLCKLRSYGTRFSLAYNIYHRSHPQWWCRYQSLLGHDKLSMELYQRSFGRSGFLFKDVFYARTQLLSVDIFRIVFSDGKRITCN